MLSRGDEDACVTCSRFSGSVEIDFTKMAAASAGTERAVLQRWKHRSYQAIPLLLLGRPAEPELTPQTASQERTSG